MNLKDWCVENGKYNILVGKSSRDIVLKETVEIISETTMENNVPECYKTGKIYNVSDQDFEKLLKEKLPSKILKIEEISDSNSIEQIRQTKIGNYIYNIEIKKANEFFAKQNVDKGYRIIKRIQKPIRRFYERIGASITKEMVDELIEIAKTNSEKFDIDFTKIYLDDSIDK